MAQSQGGTEFQPADILKYFEELKRGPNTEIGTKDIFEMAYSIDSVLFHIRFYSVTKMRKRTQERYDDGDDSRPFIKSENQD